MRLFVVKIGPEFFYLLIYKPSYCNTKVISKVIFLLSPPTLNIICFVEKTIYFCLCIFESDTVKSGCPVQIFRKIVKY